MRRFFFIIVLLVLTLFFAGCGGSGSSGSSETNTAPSTPGTISASNVTINSAQVCWEASSDVDGNPITYEVEYGKNNTPGWTSAGTTTSTCKTLSGLESDTTYVVRARALDGNGGVSAWNEQDPVFTTNPPDIPLSEYPYQYANDPLEWAPVEGASSYNVYLGKDKAEVTNATDPDTPPGRGNHTNTIYYPGTFDLYTTYYWRIDAVASSGTPQKGKVWEFYVPGTPGPPPDGEPVGGHAGYTQIVDISESAYIVINNKEELTSVLDLLSTVEEETIYINDDVVIDLIGDLIGENNLEIPSGINLYIVVDTKEELKLALELLSLTNGGIIYVRDDAEIDLTGEKLIEIPSGVTLASGRGKNYSTQGGLIYKSEHMDSDPLFGIDVGKENVRITGLRLRGPGTTPKGSGEYGSRCITTWSNIEIDNCEIYNWSYSAISCNLGAQPSIHHNYIHHCMNSVGYGVEIGTSVPYIEANVFKRCNHSIAGTGKDGCGYEACYNIVLNGGYGHSFDMHSPQEFEIPTPDPSVYGAGDWIHIHHNTVAHIWYPAVKVRGKPRVGAEINDNWFFHDDISFAVKQVNNPDYTHFDVHDNYLTIDKIDAPSYPYPSP